MYGLNAPVLVLNRNYLPVRITTARRALMMMYVGAARALDAEHEPYDFTAWKTARPVNGEEMIRTSGGQLMIPRLVLLSRYSQLPLATLRLSRRNVLLRDNYCCQYCGRQLAPGDLDLDHVIPRSRGGTTTWENLVASCRACNLRKGNATPEEAGMKLLGRPFRPSWRTTVQLASVSRRFQEWEPFLAAIPDRERFDRRQTA